MSNDTTREFRNALGRFATGIAIVTADVDGVRLGSTISSFNSVSLDPPLVLFSLIKKSFGFEKWKAATSYCIAILSESQRELSDRFAKAGADKWNGMADLVGKNGAPKVPDAICYFECEPYSTSDGGDHEIFVCRVTHFHAVPEHRPSLIFFSGKYHQLVPLGGDSRPPPENLWLHGW